MKQTTSTSSPTRPPTSTTTTTTTSPPGMHSSPTSPRDRATNGSGCDPPRRLSAGTGTPPVSATAPSLPSLVALSLPSLFPSATTPPASHHHTSNTQDTSMKRSPTSVLKRLRRMLWESGRDDEHPATPTKGSHKFVLFPLYVDYLYILIYMPIILFSRRR